MAMGWRWKRKMKKNGLKKTGKTKIGKIKILEGPEFTSRSIWWKVLDSTGKKIYSVSFTKSSKDGIDFECECEDYLFRVLHKKKKYCKHIELCKKSMDDLEKR